MRQTQWISQLITKKQAWKNEKCAVFTSAGFNSAKPLVTAPSVSLQMLLDLTPKGGDEFVFETPGYAMHTFLEDGWVTHFGQLPFQSDFSGPWPFVNTINPDE